MANFKRIEPLPHIVIEREPPQESFRTRRGRPGIRPRSNRREHAERIKDQTAASASKLARLRESFGVSPDRFLVLRLETLDSDQRDALDRLDVAVVEEVREKRDGTVLIRLLVQFPDGESLSKFCAEYDNYAEETSDSTALPHGMRRDLFDALESVSTITPEERTGQRLRREGPPREEQFYLDVDLWNPGAHERQRELSDAFRTFVQSRGGRVVRDPLITPSLFLFKVEANQSLLDGLLNFDPVSLVDLPPSPPPEDAFDFFAEVIPPDPLPPVPSDGPLACVVDSGVTAGHPLLRDIVIEEVDFDSGEGTATDLNGHGTQVAGQVVYGDIARRMQGNEWFPQVRLLSAKVLRNDPNALDPESPEATFPVNERVEDQLKRAIEYFHREYRCRVFNLSIGHSDRPYTRGRQLPWAEVLDELVRRLDIVIVVSAGNVPNPEMPSAFNSAQFKEQVAEALKEPKHGLIDPATSALSLTVGAIARRDDPSLLSLSAGSHIAASEIGCPSPFTRCGPGVAGAVKPEVVAHGGNFGLDSVAGSTYWRKEDPRLGEPTLNRDFASGRLLRAVCGTSFAAAQVTHIAARMEAALRRDFRTEPSQNLVRALLVNSARPADSARRLYDEGDLLNTVGYGQPDVEYCWSTPNRVSLVAEDIVPLREFHVYSLVVPEVFLRESGRRSISVSLAYDPPTRLSRRDYIATAMWLEVFGGLTTEQVVEYRSKYQGDGEEPVVPKGNELKFKPAKRTVKMSTVQQRSWSSNQGTIFTNRPDPSGEASMHIFVGCQERFTNPLGEDSQRYALVVTLEHESQDIDVYQQLRASVRTRARIGLAG